MPLDPNLDLTMRSMLIILGMAATILLAISVSWALAIDRIRRGMPLVPSREGGPVRWGGGAVVLCFLVWQAAQLGASLILRSRRGDGGELDLIEMMTAVGAINLGLIVVLPALLAALSGASLADLGVRRGTIGADLGLGVAAALFSIPIVYGVQFAAILIWKPTAHPLQEMLIEDRSPWVMALAFVSAVILAPMAEELLFRGILQGWLERKLHLRRSGDSPAEPNSEPPGDAEFGGIGTASREPEPAIAVDEPSVWAAPRSRPTLGGDPPLGHRPDDRHRALDRIAIVFPALFFAAVHAGQWPAPVPLFVLAMGLGLLYRRTKGIVAPIAMHATFNGLSTVAMIVVLLVIPEVDPDAIPAPIDPAATAAPDAEAPETEPGPPG